MSNSHRLHVTLPAGLHAMLLQEAKESGLNKAEIVRNAIWQMFQNRAAYLQFVNQQLEAARLEDTQNE